LEGGETFRTGRMNSDQIVEVFFRRSQRNHSGKPLRYFAGVGAEVVKSNYLEKKYLLISVVKLVV
jgi:hypothetical protein